MADYCNEACHQACDVELSCSLDALQRNRWRAAHDPSDALLTPVGASVEVDLLPELFARSKILVALRKVVFAVGPTGTNVVEARDYVPDATAC